MLQPWSLDRRVDKGTGLQAGNTSEQLLMMLQPWVLGYG